MTESSRDIVEIGLSNLASLAVESGVADCDFAHLARTAYLDAKVKHAAKQTCLREIDDQIAKLQQEKRELTEGTTPAGKRSKTLRLRPSIEDSLTDGIISSNPGGIKLEQEHGMFIDD